MSTIIVFEEADLPARIPELLRVCMSDKVDCVLLLNLILQFMQGKSEGNYFLETSKFTYRMIYQSNTLPKDTTENTRLRLYGLTTAVILELLPWLAGNGIPHTQHIRFVKQSGSQVVLEIK